MAVSVELPQMGESVTEGTIIRWLKVPGDWVEADEPIVEISTDKIDTELPAPASGVLVEIKVAEDATVEVGTEIAVIDETARKGEERAPGGDGQVKAKERPARARRRDEGAVEASAPEVAEQERPPSEVLSPLVRKLARERGVDVSGLRGTGPGGRVTKRDVLEAATGARAPAAAAPPAAQPSAFRVPAGASEDVPFTHIRKAIAEHMSRSRRTAAHLTSIVEVDMSPVARLRERAKDHFRAAEGFTLTFLPFAAAAAVQALRAFPEFNAHVLEDGKTARVFREVNIGIAVGRDEGLIVPVVKGADGMNLVGLARAINDVGTRARAKGGLKPDDVSGGTFTITNYGSLGGVMDTPIINQPQVAILGTGAVVKRPTVVSLEGGDAIAIRQIAFHSLSYDHRWIDGHRAALFNVRIKQILEEGDFAHELGLEPEEDRAR